MHQVNQTTSINKNHVGVYEVAQRFWFDAAHHLQRDIETESSKRIHGHTYHAEVAVRGCPHSATGMVVDLGHLREHVATLRLKLDHHLLDEVPHLGAPTLENLCAFVVTHMAACGVTVCRVSVWRESIGDRCDWRSC